MTLDQLKTQRTTLLLQRSALKDQLEQIEQALRQIAFGVSLLEAQTAPTPPEAPTD